MNGWERVTDPTDERRTVYWRRTVNRDEWLSVSRRGAIDQTWSWWHRSHRRRAGDHVATSERRYWTSRAARRAADAYLTAQTEPKEKP